MANNQTKIEEKMLEEILKETTQTTRVKLVEEYDLFMRAVSVSTETKRRN